MRYRTVAIVEDDQHMARYLQGILEPQYFCWWFDSGEALLEFLQHHPSPDVILSDYLMPKMDGLELFQELKTQYTEPSPFVLITAFLDRSVRQQAYQAGVFDLVTKPVAAEELRYRIEKAVLFAEYQSHYYHHIEQQRQQFATPLHFTERVEAADAQQVLRLSVNPLQHFCIVGEPGVGKRYVAFYLHYRSHREVQTVPPVVELTPSDFSSLEALQHLLIGRIEQFGTQEMLIPGILLRLGGGTIIFHHFDQLPSEMQQQVLSILEQKQVTMPGQTTSYPLGVRMMLLADDPDFSVPEAVGATVVQLRLKPLRTFAERLGTLAEQLLQQEHSEKTISLEAQEKLQQHPWYGNWEEFVHAVGKAAAAAGERQQLLLEDFLLAKTEIADHAIAGNVFQVPAGISIEELRYRYINFVKERFAHLTRQQIADMLGISRKTLWMVEKAQKQSRQQSGERKQ